MSTPGDGTAAPASITDLSARRGRQDAASARPEAVNEASSHVPDRKAQLEEARRILSAAIGQRLDPAMCKAMSRGELARLIGEAVATYLSERSVKATLLEQRDLVTVLLNELLGRSAEPGSAPAHAPTGAAPADPLAPQPEAKPAQPAATPTLDAAKRRLQSLL